MDVRREDDIYVFDVNKEGTYKTVKSDAGVRLVPVHPQLIKLGLLDWIKKNCKGGGSKPLFPDLISPKENDPANKTSKRLNRYLKTVGIKKDAELTFHSFRHAFIDELRDRDAGDHLLKKIVGHADDSVTAGYGKGAGVVKQHEVVARCYADIDFSKIVPLQRL